MRNSYLISLAYSFGIGLLLGVSLVVFRKNVFVFVYQRCGSYGCRNVSSDDYGFFLLHFGIYGLYHCGSQSPGQKYCTDVHCHHGLLRIPCDLGLYGICVFSYDSVPVPAVYVFLEHYRSGGDPVFHTDIQTKNWLSCRKTEEPFFCEYDEPADSMVYGFMQLRPLQ